MPVLNSTQKDSTAPDLRRQVKYRVFQFQNFPMGHYLSKYLQETKKVSRNIAGPDRKKEYLFPMYIPTL